MISKETMSIAFKKGIKKKIKEIYARQMKSKEKEAKVELLDSILGAADDFYTAGGASVPQHF